MKRILTLAAILAIYAAAAQVSEEESLETSLFAQEPELRLDLDRPNEMTVGSVSYSGITIQLAKTDNLAQLFNPAAPLRYGLAEDNLVRDPIDNRPVGWKLFAIQF